MSTRTQSTPTRETFEIALADCGLDAEDAPISTVEVRQSGHPSAAGQVSVHAAGESWRFRLQHDGALRPTQRVLPDGSKRQIATVPGWLQRVLATAGYDDVDAAG
jgi:hypothetical protein